MYANQTTAEATTAQKVGTPKEGARVFGCSQCSHGIEVYPPDSYHLFIQTEPCEYGDSQKIEVNCAKCGTKNIRFWDVYHPVVA